MQRISIFVLIFIVALLGLPANSYGAEQNTYRAGQPYMKTAASNHVQCEQHCRGDAQCRGWNFIRPNSGSRTGICEFNARKVRAVSSPLSMSGEVNTGVDALLSYTVPAQGRTVRVGTPIVPRKQAPKRKLVAARPQIDIQKLGQSASPKPIIKRMPIPQAKHIAAPANYQTPQLSQRLQGLPQINRQRQSMPEAKQQPSAPNLEQQFYRQQMLAAQRRAAEQAYARNYGPRSPQYRAAPQMYRPQQAQANVLQNWRNMAPAPVTRPQSYGHQPSGLYGLLHGDLTENMTPVPRPQTAPDFIDNPDAPLSTSRAAPTTPVETTPLEHPTISQLAGG